MLEKRSTNNFDLTKFSVPPNFRGKNIFIVQFWWFVQSVLFRLSPQFMYSWRSFLLRLFGAKIGKNVVIRPSVKITYPWKLEIGDNSWVGDNVNLYTLGKICIGNDCIVSQECYLCTGSHDYNKVSFEIFSEEICIGDSTWLASDVFVSSGVKIGCRSVVGARSSVFSDIGDDQVFKGSPASFVRGRAPIID